MDVRRHEPLRPDDDPDPDPTETDGQEQAFELSLATGDVQAEERDPGEERRAEAREDHAFPASFGHVGSPAPPSAIVVSPRRRPTNTAARTNADSPMTTATKPSATGPMPPIGAPPGVGAVLRKRMYATRSVRSESFIENFGITPGPTSIASPIWTSVAWPRPTAKNPPPTALPAPVAAWQAAQFAL